MTNKEICDLIREFPETPIWIFQNYSSITYAEAKAMMAARRKILKRAS